MILIEKNKERVVLYKIWNLKEEVQIYVIKEP